MESLNYLLDTNVVIYLQKGLLQEPLPHGRMAISIITEIELRSYSGLTGEQEIWLIKFFANIQSIGLTLDIKEMAIHLRRQHHLKIPDAIIAASALIHGAALLSNDEQFHSIPGINCRKLKLNY